MGGITTKSIYGLAAMHTLSHAPYGRTMQIREIAAMTGVSHPYLEQLLGNLRRAGLVVSVRGAGGGYRLAVKPSEVTVLQIVEALEGPPCRVDGPTGASVVLEAFWQDIERRVRALFELPLSELDPLFQPYHYAI